MITSQVTDQKISLEDFAAIVSDESAGAIVLFSGDVRNHDHGRKVLKLIYEVHPSAPQVLEKIVKEIAAQHGGKLEILDNVYQENPKKVGTCMRVSLPVGRV